MNWLYNNKEVLSVKDMPPFTFGFIYLITHIPTGIKYIGKKQLFSVRNVPYSKKAYEELKRIRKEMGMRGATPKKQSITKESNWLNYYSSNKGIMADVKQGKSCEYKREILEYARNKKHLTYLEVKHQFQHNVLEDEMYLNDNVLGKFYSTEL